MSGDFSALKSDLGNVGLQILHVAALSTAGGPRTALTALVIGHAGGQFWPHFARSPEAHDGAPDRLDRWSRRVISAAAPDLAFCSPSDGPPYLPLSQLLKGSKMHKSPLGMHVHEDFGLWTAVRGVLLSSASPASAPRAASRSIPPASPCKGCAEPCLRACPVNAFTAEGYDAKACAHHLLTTPDAACWHGCLARRACPVAPDLAYPRAQAKFYMDTFTAAMEKRGVSML